MQAGPSNRVYRNSRAIETSDQHKKEVVLDFFIRVAKDELKMLGPGSLESEAEKYIAQLKEHKDPDSIAAIRFVLGVTDPLLDNLLTRIKRIREVEISM